MLLVFFPSLTENQNVIPYKEPQSALSEDERYH